MCHHLDTRAQPYPLSCRKRLAEEKGAELVEAAFVIPMLLMLLIGMVWIAQAYNVYHTMTRATREGARFAVIPSCASCGNAFPTETEVRTVIDAALSVASLKPNLVSNFTMQRNVVLNPTTIPQETGVVISYDYPFTFFMPFTSVHLTSISIPISIQMREER